MKHQPEVASSKRNCENVEHFSKEAKHLLGYYVYRLVDPRNGKTFYVGKGTGDRVFQHAKGVAPSKWDGRSDEDEGVSPKTAKIDLIDQIKKCKLQVQYYIHRHDMTADVAYEVEGALIDAYAGLTNIQNGHGNRERGCMSVQQIEDKAKTPTVLFGKAPFLIIKIHKETVEDRGSVYEAVRRSWVIDPIRAKGVPVVACVDGEIAEVFHPCKWRKLPSGKRYAFTGDKATTWTALFKGKLLPEEFRRKGQANPICYVNYPRKGTRNSNH